jgi:predicted SnoaL-like aldol condensation-catalyzing enzyme
MPRVGRKHFSYTAKGKKAAASYAAQMKKKKPAAKRTKSK